MNWLITGGCGFIGSNLVNALLAQGKEVVVLDNLSRIGSADNLAWLRSRHGNHWRFLQADVRDPQAIDNAVTATRPSVIIHLAGQVAMTTSLLNPRLDFEVNALGTLNVLESVRLHSDTSIVLYSSTNKVYGSLEHLRYQEEETRYILSDYPKGLGEDLALDGHSPYGCSKLAGDQYVRDYYRMYGIPTVVFRHSSIYGGRQFATYDQGWIGWFCHQALSMENPRKLAFSINGNGKQVRDVLHADDLIRAYQMAVQNIQKTAGRIYNIGGGPANSLSLLELFLLLESLTGNSMRFQHLDWRLGDQKVFVSDTQRAQDDFGLRPEVSKERGIRNMLEWCRNIYYEQTNPK